MFCYVGQTLPTLTPVCTYTNTINTNTIYTHTYRYDPAFVADVGAAIRESDFGVTPTKVRKHTCVKG